MRARGLQVRRAGCARCIPISETGKRERFGIEPEPVPDSECWSYTKGYVAGMPDPLDVPLEDTDLLEETVLSVELIVAANEAPDDGLPQEAIDRLLGV